MRAVFYSRFGGAEVLKTGDLADPVPAPGEVLVRVRAAGVNPIDWKLASGAYKAFFPYAFPVIPGWDVAGDVAALGPGVTGFAIGDHVHGYARKPTVQWGCYAELVAVDAAALATMPAGMTMAEAAAVPLVGLTAWQALVGFGAVAPGTLALIPAAAGGVGSIAVPLAKSRGATVVATCGTANVAAVSALGADHVIDYRTQDVTAAVRALAPEGVDFLLDSLGGEAQAGLVALVRDGGTVAALNDPVPEAMASARGLRCERIFSSPDGAALAELDRLLSSGALPKPEVETLPLERAAEAFSRSMAGHVRGKLVLTL